MSKLICVAPVVAGKTLTSRTKRVYIKVDGKIRSCLFEQKEVTSNLGETTIRAAYATEDQKEIEALKALDFKFIEGEVTSGRGHDTTAAADKAAKEAEKAKRAEMFNRLEELGAAKPARNIKTEKLEELLIEAEEAALNEVNVWKTALEEAKVEVPENASAEEIKALYDELQKK